MRKDQNNSLPMMDAIKTLNEYGLEVISGIILGLDTDSDDTEQRLKDFIDLSNIPTLTINLLQALPKTALWDRLQRSNRLNEDASRESNVVFLRPYDEVVATWRRAISHAYNPENLFKRFVHQIDATYAKRIKPPAKGQLTRANLCRAAVLVYNVVVELGIKSDYRRVFWRAALHALRRGRIDAVLAMGFMAYHLIQFTREALRGDQNASFYATRGRDQMPAPAPQPQELPALRRSA
jgi:hopanoid C-2 methylase